MLKKISKKSIYAILSFIMVFFLLPKNSYANNSASTIDKIKYCVVIDSSSEKIVSIKDTEKGTEDLLTYDKISGNLYLNHNQVGKISDVIVEDEKEDISLYGYGDKTLVGTYHKYVSWIEGTTVAIVAFAISAAIGAIGGPEAVIAAIGYGALGILASQTTGGTAHWTKWSTLYFYGYFIEIDWAFKANTGERYGTYYYSYIIE
ncbi:MAG: hypothetical protein SPG13_05660 [Peptostreptococcus porci]|uniref:hypothetical protein n=1 Tax=Peptostreptococcus porci TaxID=2652282 RepID=UPI002A7476CB|nr:hypothetical protein [Peptostreptococcus porci]MDY2794744.1 hypothetical protein [Peptostreptococcus porci]MDY5479934.1 hypothetical protein [Peptostreptococcus porci]